MIKDILLPLTDTQGDSNAIEAALSLAAVAQAHLTVLDTVYMPAPIPGAWSVAPDASSMQQIYTEVRAMAEVQATRLRERLGHESVSTEVRLAETVVSGPRHIAALHARYADLAMLTSAGDDAGERSAVSAIFSGLLFESGRPVLIVPRDCKCSFPSRHVVVAWRPTREAARAVHDAMPWLQMADSVDLLEVEPASDQRSDDGALPGTDIATHLARHGIKVQVVIHQQRNESISTALLRHCDQSSAHLLVAGGYGHSRFREWMLGGTTRELLRFAHLPVLFSH